MPNPRDTDPDAKTRLRRILAQNPELAQAIADDFEDIPTDDFDELIDSARRVEDWLRETTDAVKRVLDDG